MGRRLKIKLIEPARYNSDGTLRRLKRIPCPPMTLPLLAALAPDDVDVAIHPEAFTDVDFDEPADLVGITVYTTRGMRAYKIADEYRRRGVPVVLGGIHASMEPDEAAAHADTVIVGEAEETWPQFIEDFRTGAAKARYVAEHPPPLAGLPVPRYSLLDRSRYSVGHRAGLLRSHFMRPPWFPVQTARGCPYNCEFCSVTAFNGGRYRMRPIEDVVAEITALRPRTCFFVDDDIFARPARAKELFRALIPLRIRWIAQAGLGAARDTELLRLARRSGCLAVLIGLESLCPAQLDSVGKTHQRVADYKALLRNYRRAGIGLMVSMMFGFGPEPPTAFDEAADFLVKNRAAFTKWWPVTPLPGTRLFERLRREGRLKHPKWWLEPPEGLDALDLRFTGIEMGTEAFRRNYRNALARFYSLQNIARRLLLPPQRNWLPAVLLNLKFRRKLGAEDSIMET